MIGNHGIYEERCRTEAAPRGVQLSTRRSSVTCAQRVPWMPAGAWRAAPGAQRAYTYPGVQHVCETERHG
eukprot:2700071-Prymnesium_polylepis.1